ncbi:TIGR04255 family protein [Proteiniphilum sp. X52]|uniref:TIGR04255 family protein n=1 Tax=Proteiniphilum sp. X52 TaxID=2382159 RepID=UPI000F0A54A8|nr:TIGR04255 family protein [Proteiniphilum sp. X52]RNC65706.1 TIGR04255 family protein [Proteiniphilum sp. X52]
MSKLPKAPLIEVIFELTWPINNGKEQEKFQFLLGDIYSKLRSEYPNRLRLVQPPNVEIPLEILANKPVYRFSKNESYPLYQIGPGLLSVNTVDSHYFWEQFEKEIVKITKVFKESYDFEKDTLLNMGLKYIDFFEFNFNHDAFEFLHKLLHLDIKHNIRPEKNNNPVFFTFASGYNEEIGLFNVIINRGGYNNKEGFVIETNVSKKISSTDFNILPSWLEEAHSFLSEKFKKMTEGEMYNSFK